jgi:protein ATS1
VERTFSFERPGKGLGQITDVAATWEASFVVVGRKVVFGCGSGSKGELGLGEEVSSTPQMMKVFQVDDANPSHGTIGEHEESEILQIEACMSHVVIVLSNGHVFGWGNCRKGQLGEKCKGEKSSWKPRRIDDGFDGVGRLPFKTEMVALGREYTAFLKSGEKLLIWGETKAFPDAGLDSVLEEGASVASGWSSIHTLSCTRGAVKAVGRNHRGQLAPANIPPLRALAAGSEHCIALTTDNQVIAWGWGEHGNCGEETDPKGAVVGRWNVIPLPPRQELVQLKTVAAGCATSFVIYGNKG